MCKRSEVGILILRSSRGVWRGILQFNIYDGAVLPNRTAAVDPLPALDSAPLKAVAADSELPVSHEEETGASRAAGEWIAVERRQRRSRRSL